MASWIRQDEEASKRGLIDGVGVDADELEGHGAEFEFSEEVYAKARLMFMDDLRLAGASLRELERWFGVSKSEIQRRFADRPPIPADATTSRYHARLAEVIRSKPRSFAELVTQMQAKAGTADSTARLLFALGSRARSADVALGQKQAG